MFIEARYLLKKFIVRAINNKLYNTKKPLLRFLVYKRYFKIKI